MGESVWSEVQQREYQERERLRLLFEGRHEVYFTLPDGREEPWEYIKVNWLGDLLSQTWKRLLFRKFPMLSTQAGEQKPVLEEIERALGLRRLCPTTALMVSWAGKAVWKVYWSRLSGRPVARIWGNHPGEIAFLETLPTDRSKAVAVDFWYSVEVAGEREKETFWVCERHALQVAAETGRVSAVEMTVAAHKSAGGVPSREGVPLAAVWPDAASRPKEREITPGLTVLPCVVIHNPDRGGDGEGDTDYTESLISVQKAENKLMASRQYTIDIGETPSVTVPADTVDPATNRADLAKAKIRVRYPGEPADVMEVTNWTGNLQNSAEQHRFYRREFCTLAGLSPALGGEAEGSGGESGYARRLGMVPTEAEAGSRQECWDAAFGEVVEVARQLLRVYGGRSDFPAEALVVSTAWPATIPEDAQEASTTATQEHRQGVRSTRSAIERLNPDWDAERVDAEEAAIRQEREEAAAPARVALPGG